MKIVIAPDSFKGSLSAVEAAEAMACGVLRAKPEAKIVKIPLADGGEGTTAVLVSALKGELCECLAQNPIGREISACYGVVAVDGVQTAIIEVAAASGLTLVDDKERNALRASSYGTGQLIRDALDRGFRNFIIGLGGSATTDAGKGMLEALGVRFYDESGKLLCDGGGSLSLLSQIDISEMDERLQECNFRVMCDVENVLYGETGAAYIFAPQKGATSEDVLILNCGLQRFAECVKRDLKCDISRVLGGGAAGGLGAALVAFFNAKLVSGAELLLKVTDFDKNLNDADLVLTGEGKIDSQTMMGKLLSHVLRSASSRNVPVVAFAGVVEGKGALVKSGFKDVCCINRNGEKMEIVMNKNVALNNLADSVFNFCQDYKS